MLWACFILFVSAVPAGPPGAMRGYNDNSEKQDVNYSSSYNAETSSTALS